MGTIRYAKIDTSPRLQRTLELLRDGHWHSTRDIVRAADVCAVNSIIAELRCNGYDVITRKQKGRYEYQLVIEGQGGLF